MKESKPKAATGERVELPSPLELAKLVELPSPLQLAELAALIGFDEYSDPKLNEVPMDAAIHKAVRLYLRAVCFQQEHGSDSLEKWKAAVATPMERASERLRKSAAERPTDIPKPKKFPAKLKEFFRLIVKAKTEADCYHRFRHFLEEYSSSFGDRPVVELQKIKDKDRHEGYFTESLWLLLAIAYRGWWSVQRSIKAHESARVSARARRRN